MTDTWSSHVTHRWPALKRLIKQKIDEKAEKRGQRKHVHNTQNTHARAHTHIHIPTRARTYPQHVHTHETTNSLTHTATRLSSRSSSRLSSSRESEVGGNCMISSFTRGLFYTRCRCRRPVRPSWPHERLLTTIDSRSFCKLLMCSKYCLSTMLLSESAQSQSSDPNPVTMLL